MSLVFPRWANAIPAAAVVALGGAAVAAVGTVWYYFTPEFWEVGYEPEQPVDFSHQLHVGKLGLDCRYCHSYVEESYHANIPDTNTCMNCHQGEGAEAYLNADLWRSHQDNQNLIAVREAYSSGEPIQWRRIHKLPDYAKFNHAVHVASGVSCYSCHGRIDQQSVVRQEHSLSMGWCLDCHRGPERFLVDHEGILTNEAVEVTDLATVAALLGQDDQIERGLKLAEAQRLQPPQHCAACHY